MSLNWHLGPIVQRLGHEIFTLVIGVRFPVGLLMHMPYSREDMYEDTTGPDSLDIQELDHSNFERLVEYARGRYAKTLDGLRDYDADEEARWQAELNRSAIHGDDT